MLWEHSIDVRCTFLRACSLLPLSQPFINRSCCPYTWRKYISIQQGSKERVNQTLMYAVTIFYFYVYIICRLYADFVLSCFFFGVRRNWDIFCVWFVSYSNSQIHLWVMYYSTAVQSQKTASTWKVGRYSLLALHSTNAVFERKWYVTVSAFWLCMHDSVHAITKILHYNSYYYITQHINYQTPFLECVCTRVQATPVIPEHFFGTCHGIWGSDLSPSWKRECVDVTTNVCVSFISDNLNLYPIIIILN